MSNITKRFGSVVANHKVSLSVREGEILSILGENGSGKTTLMNMISGIYFPDEGQIFVRGKEAVIRSPRDAFELKIGMIHQHFKLVDVFSAAENIVLGLKEAGRYDIRKVASRVKEISEKYDFDIDLKSGRYIVDAKSIMGIFSLDLMNPIELSANIPDEAERAAFEADIKRFCI